MSYQALKSLKMKMDQKSIYEKRNANDFEKLFETRILHKPMTVLFM